MYIKSGILYSVHQDHLTTCGQHLLNIVGMRTFKKGFQASTKFVKKKEDWNGLIIIIMIITTNVVLVVSQELCITLIHSILITI